jgi:hypothetical protein
MYGNNHKVMVRIYKTIIDKPKKIWYNNYRIKKERGNQKWK